MKLLTTLLLVAPFFSLGCCSMTCCDSCAAGESCEVAEAASWQPLFDGTTTTGWVNYGQTTMSGGWQALDGALTMTGGGGDIITEKTYESFELELEWQVAEGGNSGIFYNVQPGESAVYATGPEMQVLDNTKHADGKNPFTSAGSCYALYQPVRDVTKPVGEWNHARLVNKNGHVEHWLNGVKLCEYVLGSDDWNSKVAASKFKDMPKFGKYTSGHIALQDHGDRVAFRNMRIREL